MNLHQVIYIPGLGDHRPWGQNKIFKLWRLSGIQVRYQPIGWADSEDWPPKLERLIKKIDELATAGNQISLVGVSAGASAALNVYMARPEKIASLVFICGKLTHPETVNPRYYIQNPAFKQSLELAQANIVRLTPADKAKMLSLQPFYDNTVPVADTKIAGVKNCRILSVGHIISIFLAVSLYRGLITSFIKARA